VPATWREYNARIFETGGDWAKLQGDSIWQADSVQPNHATKYGYGSIDSLSAKKYPAYNNGNERNSYT
jgi:hypothetical protein